MHAPLVVLLLLLLAGCAAPQTPARVPEGNDDGAPSTTPVPPLRLEPFAAGFERPLLMTFDPADPGTFLVVEQGGRIWTLRDGRKGDAPWLDLSEKVTGGTEQGLLGLAFSPDQPGIAYVSYTDANGDSALARVRHANGRADATSEEIFLRVEQPYANHNGGHILFGPDGKLWYGLGDGGSAGDPQDNGQDPNSLLGSLLRLDVSGGAGYGVPPDNPYANGGGRGEVWAKGLRNPWRFSFDRATGDLWIGDVGQDEWEEIDFLAAGAPGGANFGWNAYEGNHRFKLLARTFSDPTPPVAEYTLAEGRCSVTGGHVYRGAAEPALEGTYVFGDYCSGTLWTLTRSGESWSMRTALETDLRISSFAEDADGEIYVIDHGGRILRLVAD